MISKKEFIHTIAFIKDQNKKQGNLINALEALSPGSYCDCFIYSRYESKIISLLMGILDDKNEEIMFFLYDLDYINDSEISEKDFPKDDEGNILYNSVDTLYDYLVGEMKHE